jgi:hypothetical protein
MNPWASLAWAKLVDWKGLRTFREEGGHNGPSDVTYQSLGILENLFEC